MTVVFDAECLLCNGWVQFILANDRRGVFRFASMQGRHGRQLILKAGLDARSLETLIVAEGSRLHRHTDAILRVLEELGMPWRTAALARAIPGPLRDSLYRKLARNRNRLFGTSEQCFVPAADERWRFLD